MAVAIPLEQIRPEDAEIVGGKAAALARMLERGIAVPAGISVPTDVYRRYLAETGLGLRIARELSRKPFSEMRWEELWDASLRIRSMFLHAELPGELEAELARALRARFDDRPVAVRSSAPGEDAERTSFAGLHESFVNVRGVPSILDHVRLVWASLWSDRALLYRRELELDVASSAMAVLVQELVPGDRSGVAFSESPVSAAEAVIEAVYGLNQGLVDGSVQPDRWVLDRWTGRVLEHRPAERAYALAPSSEGVERRALSAEQMARAPLATAEVGQVHRLARSLEESFGRPQDVEWTFFADRLCALQARPITKAAQADDERRWYLTLTRSLESLRELRNRIEGELLPEMQRVAAELARANLGELDDAGLAREIARREALHRHWVDVYWRDFIPFAHGVRLFGQVYNDALKPEDPYEFMRLLAATPLQSLRRNAMLEQLAGLIRRKPERAERLKRGEPLERDDEFVGILEAFLTEFGDLAWRGGEPAGEARLLVPLLLEMSERQPGEARARADEVRTLQERFLGSFAEGRRGFAGELLELARASHQLRDDDNIHLARIEAQLLSARAEARRRVESGEACSAVLDAALQTDADGQRPDRGSHAPSDAAERDPAWRVRPRQLVGQPASPGVASGAARVVARPSDLFEFKRGEILVCDAVQPHMTLVVPLAAGIVERRGGMLIHGAIIAREYGIPCVTGVPDASSSVRTGEVLTVDGHLGLVVRRPLRGDETSPEPR